MTKAHLEVLVGMTVKEARKLQDRLVDDDDGDMINVHNALSDAFTESGFDDEELG